MGRNKKNPGKGVVESNIQQQANVAQNEVAQTIANATKWLDNYSNQAKSDADNIKQAFFNAMGVKVVNGFIQNNASDTNNRKDGFNKEETKWLNGEYSIKDIDSLKNLQEDLLKQFKEENNITDDTDKKFVQYKKRIDKDFSALTEFYEVLKGKTLPAVKGNAGINKRHHLAGLVSEYLNKRNTEFNKKREELTNILSKAAEANNKAAVERAKYELNQLSKQQNGILHDINPTRPSIIPKSTKGAFTPIPHVNTTNNKVQQARLGSRAQLINNILNSAEQQGMQLSTAVETIWNDYIQRNAARDVNAKNIDVIDFETSGINTKSFRDEISRLDIKRSLPAVFGYGGVANGKQYSGSSLVDLGSKEDNIKNLMVAMNLRKGKQLIESAQGIRSMISQITGESYNEKNNLTYEEIESHYSKILSHLRNPAEQLLDFLKASGRVDNKTSISEMFANKDALKDISLLAYNGTFDVEQWYGMLQTYLQNTEKSSQEHIDAAKTLSVLFGDSRLADINTPSILDHRAPITGMLRRASAQTIDTSGLVKDGDLRDIFADIKTIFDYEDELGNKRNYIMSNIEEASSLIPDTAKLQSIIRLIFGETSDLAHMADDDSDFAAKIKVFLSSNFGQEYFAHIKLALANRIKQFKEKGGEIYDLSRRFTSGYINTIKETFLDSRGILSSNPELANSKVASEITHKSVGTLAANDVLSKLDKLQKESFEGNYFAKAAKAGAGLKVNDSSISRGYTSDYKLFVEAVDELSKDNIVWPEDDGNGNIRLVAIPKNLYDASQTNQQNVERLGKENILQFDGKIARDGLFNDGRVNGINRTTLFDESKNAYRGYVTDSALAWYELTQTLRRNAEATLEEKQRLGQQAMNRVYNDSHMVHAPDAEDEYRQQRSRVYDADKKTQIQALQEGNISLNHLIYETLWGKDVQTAIRGWAEEQGKKRNVALAIRANQFIDPRHDSDMFSRLMRDYVRIATGELTADNAAIFGEDGFESLLFENEAFKYFIADAKDFGLNTPIDNSYSSDSTLAKGIVNYRGSKMEPGGGIGDTGTKAASQFMRNLPYTKKAQELREKLLEENKIVPNMVTTPWLKNSNVDMSSVELALIPTMAISELDWINSYLQEKISDYGQEKWEKLSQDQKNALTETWGRESKTIMDMIGVTSDFANINESMIPRNSKTIPAKEVTSDVLNLFGISLDDYIKLSEGEALPVPEDKLNITEETLLNIGQNTAIEIRDKIVAVTKTMAGAVFNKQELSPVEEGTKLSLGGEKGKTSQLIGETGKNRLVEYYRQQAAKAAQQGKADEKNLYTAKALAAELSMAFFEKRSEIDIRKFEPEFMGLLNTILAVAKQRKGDQATWKEKDLYDALINQFEVQTGSKALSKMLLFDENAGQTPFLTAFGYDTTTGGFSSYDKTGANPQIIFQDEEEAKKLYSGLEKAGLEILKNFVGLEDVEAQAAMFMRYTKVAQQATYDYNDMMGYANPDNLYKYGRVSMDPRRQSGYQRSQNAASSLAKAISSKEEWAQLEAGYEAIKDETLQFSGKMGQNQERDVEFLSEVLKSLSSISLMGGHATTTDDDLVLNPDELKAIVDELIGQNLTGQNLIEQLKANTDTKLIDVDKYENSIMFILRKVALEKNKKNIVLRDNSGKTYKLSDRAGTLHTLSTGDSGYEAGTLDRANTRLIGAILDESSDIQENKLDLQKEVANTHNTYQQIEENLRKKQKVNQGRFARSGYKTLSGTAQTDANHPFAIKTGRQANTVYMSEDDFRIANSTAEIGSREQINQNRRENVGILLQNYKIRSGADKNYDSRYISNLEENLANILDADLIKIEQDIITKMIDSIKSGNTNYLIRDDRYPFTTSELGGYSTLAFHANREDRTVMVSPAKAESIRGDYDSDHTNIVIDMPADMSESRLKASLSFRNIQDDIMMWLTKNLQAKEDLLTEEGINKNREDSIAKLETIFAGTRFKENYLANNQGKETFTLVGALSNMSLHFKDNMANFGFSTSEWNTAEELLKNFQSDLLSGLFEAFEQDAISSKKLQARLAKRRIDRGEGVTSAMSNAFADVEKIISSFKSGDYGQALSMMQEQDIISDLLKQKQFGTVRAKYGVINEKASDRLKEALGQETYGQLERIGFFNPEVVKDTSDNKEATSILNGVLIDSFKNITDSLQSKKGPKDETVWKTLFKDNSGNTHYRESISVAHAEELKGEEAKATGEKVKEEAKKSQTTVENGNIIANSGNIYVSQANLVDVEQAAIVTVTADSVTVSGGSSNSSGKGSFKQESFLDLGAKYEGSKFEHLGLVSDADAEHRRVIFDDNGKILENKTGHDNVSVSTLTQKPFEAIQSFYDGNNSAAALGTYGHFLTESALIINGQVQDIAESVLWDAKEKLGSSPELGGMGYAVTPAQMEEYRLRSKNLLQYAVDTNAINETSAREVNLGAKVGNRYLTGAADAISFIKDENGNYTGVTGVDWKMSQHGGENEAAYRAGRLAQISNYLHMAKTDYSYMSELNASDFTAKNTPLLRLLLNYDYKVDENTSDAEMQAVHEDVKARFTAFKNMYVRLIRSFIDKNNNEMIDDLQTTALSEEETLRYNERAAHGLMAEQHLQDKVVAKGNTVYKNITTGQVYENGARPELIQKQIDEATVARQLREKAESSSANKAMQEQLALLREEYKLKADITNLEKSKLGQSGQELLSTQQLLDVYNNRLRVVQRQKMNVSQNANGIITLSNGTNQYTLSEEQSASFENKRNKYAEDFNAKIIKQNSNLKQQKSLSQSISDAFKMTMTRFIGINAIAYSLAGRLRTVLNSIVQYTKSLDSSIVNLQIASGESYDNVKNMMKDFNRLAKEVGRSTSEVASAANDWLRAGYEGQEASKLTKSSMQLSTLGMISSSDATSYLISVLKGWKLAANEVSGVVDKLTVTICGVYLVIGIGHKFKCR